MELSETKALCLGCQQCELCHSRHHVVFGVGPEDAEILFVGEGPGQQEDLQGDPFVGAGGQLLDRMLSIIGLGRHNCYITNTVKCRPPQNRDPHPEEQAACRPWLETQFAALRPKIIVCLGRIAAMELIDPEFKITRQHGQWFQKDGVQYMAMYHPAALLRDVTKRPDTYRDLKTLQAMARKLCTHTTAEPLL